jgi:hypothetical protein
VTHLLDLRTDSRRADALLDILRDNGAAQAMVALAGKTV